jgi:UDP-2,3-diacylglucosamine pyrophosphatase LpxH
MTMNARSVFVSDVHLGCRHSRADSFLEFLHRVHPQYLYVVGDFLDGWVLRRGWYWRETYSRIVRRLMDLANAGTQICYTPGNHDDFLRKDVAKLFRFGANVEVRDEFIHTTADHRRLLVMHGDQFDAFTGKFRFLSLLGDIGYNLLLGANCWVNRGWRGLGGSAQFRFSKRVKERVKLLTNAANDFENRIRNYAGTQRCHGVVCGHIHLPKVDEGPGPIAYYNTGDWVENCTALVEDQAGKLTIHQLAA